MTMNYDEALKIVNANKMLKMKETVKSRIISDIKSVKCALYRGEKGNVSTVLLLPNGQFKWTGKSVFENC